MSFKQMRKESCAAPGISLGAAVSFVLGVSTLVIFTFILLAPRHTPHHRGQTTYWVRH